MGRKRNPDKKTTQEIVREALDKEKMQFKAESKANFEAPKEQKQSDREAFSSYWASAKKSYKKAKDLEEVLWAHLKSAGFAKPELFEKGLEHFGLKK